VIGVALLAAGMLAALDLPVPGFPRAPAPHSPGWRRWKSWPRSLRARLSSGARWSFWWNLPAWRGLSFNPGQSGNHSAFPPRLLALFLSKEKDRCCHKQRSLPEQVKRWGRGGGNALKLLAYILRAPIRRGFALDQKRVYPATHAELSCSSK